MSQASRGFNYVKWTFIVAVVGVFIAVLTVPKFCSIGLFSGICPIQQKEIELISQSETGAPLANVKVQVIAQGAPEIQYTDSSGYAKVQIANKGEVRVNLSIEGYPIQDFNINLANDQNTVRIIRFAKSGQPAVSSLPTLPPKTFTSPVEEIPWNETARNLIGKVGQDFTFICLSNGTVGNVWGTDFYTSNSSICSAAVHAGIINAKDGGKVQIRIRSGEEFYNGTARNGITSNRYDSSKGSFTFLDSTGSPPIQEQIQLLEWNETASNLQGKLDQDFKYSCKENGTVNNVWGTDIYTIGSSICSAAVHAGIINAKNGGNVQIKISPGEKFYNGTTRHGVTSNRYDSYNWSFKFIK
jgi:hypothetical protein